MCWELLDQISSLLTDIVNANSSKLAKYVISRGWPSRLGTTAKNINLVTNYSSPGFFSDSCLFFFIIFIIFFYCLVLYEMNKCIAQCEQYSLSPWQSHYLFLSARTTIIIFFKNCWQLLNLWLKSSWLKYLKYFFLNSSNLHTQCTLLVFCTM